MALFTKKAYGAGDTRWLASGHGINEAKTENITVADFAADVVDGVLPSGTPVTIDAADETCKPYDGTTLSGFLLFAESVKDQADVNVAVIRHCAVYGQFLPKQIAEPTTVDGNIVFHTTDWTEA